MISITCMLIISTLQSSIDKMVPKTSYLKMVDIFLIYSFNIVIVIMGVHTYMDITIHRDGVTGIIVNTSRPSSMFWSSSIKPLSSHYCRCDQGPAHGSGLWTGGEPVPLLLQGLQRQESGEQHVLWQRGGHGGVRRICHG